MFGVFPWPWLFISISVISISPNSLQPPSISLQRPSVIVGQRMSTWGPCAYQRVVLCRRWSQRGCQACGANPRPGWKFLPSASLEIF